MLFRSTALRKLRRLKEALNDCERAIDLQRDYVEAYRTQGQVLRDLGRPDMAALSYNLYNSGVSFDGKPIANPRPWNSTKIYARVGGAWKIVHDHWSYIKPELK